MSTQRDLGSVGKGIVVAGHVQIGNADLIDERPDAGLDRFSERRQVTGVEHGADIEPLREGPGDLDPDRVGMDIADMEDRDRVFLRSEHRLRDEGDQLREAGGETLEAGSQTVERAEALVDRSDHLRGALQGTSELRLLEGGDVEGRGRQPDCDHDRHSTSGCAGSKEPEVPPADQYGGDRSDDDATQQET